MTKIIDDPSILAGHGMKLPIEGGRYRSPLGVAGTSPYSSGGLKQGQTELHFYQFDVLTEKKHPYRSDGEFAYNQPLEAGPWWLGVQHKWWWSSGDKGDETEWLSVGNFYVLTPPKVDSPAENN